MAKKIEKITIVIKPNSDEEGYVTDIYTEAPDAIPFIMLDKPLNYSTSENLISTIRLASKTTIDMLLQNEEDEKTDYDSRD